MTSEATVEGGAGRCPHLIWRNVLGGGTAAELLDYVVAQEREFKPGLLRNRISGKHRIDYSLRDAVYLLDLAAFETRIEHIVRSLAPRALDALRLTEPAVAPREFELSAYRDGGHFGAHIDTDERSSRVRVVSCVYYFAATPRRFSGGELRLHALPTLSAGKGPAGPPFVDIVPETDSLVVFPSWLRHEVLPVRVPSGAWADSRFTINCWLHRLPPPDHATEGG
jgi:Rps23 Pro-64 3,4-dihydroxylase Tpa1-like proline 4-hydroxylase